ncbi:hypothetical protein [Streptomyces sp. MA15]|uniref:hypothetical protein n=1 Tax=Streptomyces sp. MA15 TaxID=3055061 RepID=UPI0025B19F89|nr:hypothetical protein [Streptomyces sp. MA15]MDN3270388.1 hypothetical protein [Streptomyces sp. MA15]
MSDETEAADGPLVPRRLVGETVVELEHGVGARTVIIGAIGESASPVDSFLVSMRLSCRGVRVVNLGAGVTLDRAAAELACRREVEALLLICGDSARAVVRQLSGLEDLVTAGAVTRPVFVGGVRGGVWRELQGVAARLRRGGVTQVLADLADAAYLLPVRRLAVRDASFPASPVRAVSRVA